MEKYKIEKDSVQETLIIPLYGRRLCSQRFPGLYQDSTAAMLMEGHVAVIVEGSPTANVMPATLFTLMATGEDSTMRVVQGSVIRMVRYIGAAISILLPGYFLASSVAAVVGGAYDGRSIAQDGVCADRHGDAVSAACIPACA